MIPDVSYTPKRQNKIPLIVVTTALVICVVSCIFMMFGLGNQLLFQTLFVISAIVMVYFFCRYFTNSYTYTVNQTDKLFIVTQRVGRRLTTLCRLDLAALYRVRPYGDGDEAEQRHSGRYNYCVSFRPEKSYLAFFDDGEHIVSIRMELDDTFYALLARIAEGYVKPEEEDYNVSDISAGE